MGAKTWRAWTERELVRLARLRGAGRTVAECAADLGRSVASVKCRVAAEKLVRPLTRREEWVEALVRPHSIPAIAQRFGVTVGAVKRAKQRLRAQGVPVVRLRAKVAEVGPRLTGFRRKLAAEHVGLAELAARVAARRWPALADTFLTAAHVGLCRAALAFDPDRGVTFSTFASRRIAGAILDAKRDELPAGFRRDKEHAPRVGSLEGLRL